MVPVVALWLGLSVGGSLGGDTTKHCTSPWSVLFCLEPKIAVSRLQVFTGSPLDCFALYYMYDLDVESSYSYW